MLYLVSQPALPIMIVLFLILTGRIELSTPRRRIRALPDPAPRWEHMPSRLNRGMMENPVIPVRTSLDEWECRRLAWQEIEAIERACGLVNGSLVQEP